MCRFFFAFLLFILIISDALAQRPGELTKIRKQEVASIRFEGNKNVSDDELSNVISVRTSSGFDRLLNSVNSSLGLPRQFIDHNLLRRDTAAIFFYYKNNGYLDARVTYRLVEDSLSIEEWKKVYNYNKLLPPSEWKVYPNIQTTVVFTIIENEPCTVGGFTFAGLDSLPPDLLDKATEEIGIKQNTIYKRQAIVDEYSRIQKLLQENGYPFFSRDSIVVERVEGFNKVTISVWFRTSNRYKMGDVTVVYDTAGEMTDFVNSSAVRHELSFSRGDWFQLSNVRSSVKNLYALGTFESVRIELDTSVVVGVPPEKRDGMELPVVIFVRMRQTADIGPGIAVSSGSAGVAFTGKVAYNNRNFFGGAQALTLGGSRQFYPPTQIAWDINSALNFPYVGIPHVPLQVGFTYSTFEEQGRDTTGKDTTRMKVQSLAFPVNSRFRLFDNGEYRLNFAPGFLIERITSEIKDTSLLADYTQIQEEAQFNTIFTGDVVLDGTNDIFNPSRGVSLSYSIEYGTALLADLTNSPLPSAAYFKQSVQVRKFFQLSSNGQNVFALRGFLGHATLTQPGDSLRDVPQNKKFLGGGANNFRAWPSRSLLVSDHGTGTIIGGYTTLGATMELRFAPFSYPLELTNWQQFASPLRLAFFLDAGNVWDKETDIVLRNVSLTIGTGIRYNTPFGPIRADIGFKLYDPYPNLDEKNLTSFAASTQGMWLIGRKIAHTHISRIMNIEITIGNPF